MKYLTSLLIFLISSFSAFAIFGNDEEDEEQSAIEKMDYSGLSFRSIGPAMTAGRVADMAVNPHDHQEYYLGVASGGVWKTENGGTTFDPIFDNEGSYSIGCVTIDPHNEHTIWVGTGENNNQRSVAYGDGVYKSRDGGQNWENMGLKNSEHIGNIIVHPEDPDVVYVSAYGPLWDAGGDRGLYKTTNGGENWEKILDVNKHTGINEVHLDPRNPEIMYACAHQRRRHVFTYVGGGPGSAIYKSTDGGQNWRELKKGLPKSVKGRIGLDISPANPDYVYAIIEARKAKEEGFYRSTNRGESWQKMSNYSTSGNYYQEITADPQNKDKVFSMNTFLHHTEDGGKNFQKTGIENKHVDDHAMWIDPEDSNHWLLGCDGGVYETHDHAKTWDFKDNLPITQFYKVAVDNAKPFYNVYGGTQDNNTLAGPSRTVNNHGILNRDWYITKGGDGFKPAIDPKNSNIIYSQSQYGWLVRYDKQSGETVGIKPAARKGQAPLRWNWNAPLLISPHDHKRLYFAANKVFRSENRGNAWETISPDLTRQLNRNDMDVMGRVQSVDAVEKNQSTSIYGNITALAESPLKEGLLYAGTDDGLIQVSEDGGDSWQKIKDFPKVPERTYVDGILASKFDESTVYVVFNNHKEGDFKPYILKSTDKGTNWEYIASDLPERGSVYDLAQDHKDPDLLFTGTEFGVYYTHNGGKEWIELDKGLPTIAVRDIEIQEREDDLVLATFGRSFYILDNYAPLREIDEDLPEQNAKLFQIKDALMFVDARPLGGKGKANQGDNLFTASNPPIGAKFTYYLGDTLKTAQEKRLEQEKELIKEGKDTRYPSKAELRKEDREEAPYLLFTIYNDNMKLVRKLKEKDPKQGIQRMVWDFRHAPKTAVKLKEQKPGRYGEPDQGPLALPGTYYVTLQKVENGETSLLTDTTKFECKWLENLTLPATDKSELAAFQEKVQKLRRAVEASQKVKKDLDKRLKYIEKAVETSPELDISLLQEVETAENELYKADTMLFGDQTLAKRQFPTPSSISKRVGMIIWSLWRSRSAPTQTNRNLYQDAGKGFEEARKHLKAAKQKVDTLQDKLKQEKTPYTPGMDLIEDWKRE